MHPMPSRSRSKQGGCILVMHFHLLGCKRTMSDMLCLAILRAAFACCWAQHRHSFIIGALKP